MSSSGGMRLKAPASGDEDGDEDASSISDVFADTLSVNEDLIVATAESQTERDLEGVIAYQRILHRNLMEMADFVDSTFGVYSNTISKVNSQIYTKTYSPPVQKENCDVQPRVDVNVTTEPVEKERPIVLNSTYEVTKTQTNKASKGVLFTALEAGEKVREVQRSKEQWIKSRDQVLEEEGVSAISTARDSTKAISYISEGDVEENSGQQGLGGVALVHQLRAHQHITAFIHSTQGSTTPATPVAAPTMVSMGCLLANQFAVFSQVTPMSTAVQPMPLPVVTAASTSQRIKPNTTENTLPKIALPPTHSMLNTFFPLVHAPSQLRHTPSAAGFAPMAWQPAMSLQTAPPTRTMMPMRARATPNQFKRMCEECRKRHFSVRRCRLVLQHTDPEWQPAETPQPIRRRKRKQNAAKP